MLATFPRGSSLEIDWLFQDIIVGVYLRLLSLMDSPTVQTQRKDTDASLPSHFLWAHTPPKLSSSLLIPNYLN